MDWVGYGAAVIDLTCLAAIIIIPLKSMGVPSPLTLWHRRQWVKKTFELKPSANPIFEQAVIHYIDRLIIERELCLEDKDRYPERAWQYLESKKSEYEMLRELMWNYGLHRAEAYAIQTGLLEKKVRMWL